MTVARIEDVSALAQAFGADMGAVDGRVTAAEEAASVAVGTATSATRAAGKTPQDFGDPVTTTFRNFIAATAGGQGVIPPGTYTVGQLGLADQGTIKGAGSNVSKLRRETIGNLINAPTQQRVALSGLELDLGRSVNGWSGHGISSVSDDARFDDLFVKDFGSDLVAGGGSGVLVVKPADGEKPVRARLTNSTLIGDPTAARSYGWIYADVDYSFVSNVYAAKIVGYAHELKNNSRYNSMVGLIGVDSNWSLAYGQETPDTNGCDMNAAGTVIAAACDGGYLIGEGFGNVLTGLVYNETGSPSRQTTKNAVRYEAGAAQNVTLGVVSIGAGVTQTVRHGDSHSNVTQVAAHDGATVLARFDGTSAGNYVEVLHSGTTPVVSGRIVYGTVTALRGADANVVHSPSTGERIGTRSGHFLDRVGASGAIFGTSHYWRYDTDKFAMQAYGIPGNVGDEAGIVVNTPTTQGTAQISFAKGSTDPNDYWLVRVGATNILRFYSSVARAATDIALDLGNAAFRFRDAFSLRFRPGSGAPIWTSGTGSPEGTVAAPVGSLYTREDGAAGATLFVKESGAGNTGWVAK